MNEIWWKVLKPWIVYCLEDGSECRRQIAEKYGVAA